MANELEKAITIKNAIDKIDSGDFLLPSIQRRFVWNPIQIEFLFDSIMQDYPINTFMFWEVEDDGIKNQFRFYDFLKKYVEYQGGNNHERKTGSILFIMGKYKNIIFVYAKFSRNIFHSIRFSRALVC